MILGNKFQNIGLIYRLIEQFELISRTDLSKLSGYAPASITNITKQLIDKHFIMEKSVQDSMSRGRPAVGLSVSTRYWKQICITLSQQRLIISLCQLDGSVIASQDYTLFTSDYPRLDSFILENLQIFCKNQPLNQNQILAISIAVMGSVDPKKTTITRLGQMELDCPIVRTLMPYFHQPILLHEHFQLWLLAESTLGSLIGDDNVIFLQLDEQIRLSVLMKGALLHQQTMNVDRMVMPKFSELSDQIAPELDSIERYQLANQITFSALAKLIDQQLPNSLASHEEKIDYLCEQIHANNEKALAILDHISSNIAYMLMNLINIFATRKIMLDSSLLQVKGQLFEQIQQKLEEKLALSGLNVQLVSGCFDKNSTLIPCAMIKQGIYEGSLIKNIIPD